MTARPNAFPLFALVCAAVLAVTGCEDDVAVQSNLPSDGEFLGASNGTLVLFPAGVNANLALLRSSANYALMADPQRRLRSMVPTSVARDVVADEVADARYDSTAGAWSVTGSATSGDSLDFTYEASIVWYDTLGARQSEIVPGLTERGTFRESVDLTFRTGDFDSLTSYETRLHCDLVVDVRVPLSAAATRDTFFVDVTGDVLVRSKDAGADSPIEVVDFQGRLFGGTGPNTNNSNCYRASEAMTARWNELEAIFQINSSGSVSISWYDPDDTIQGVKRILFAQPPLPMECR